MNKEYSNVQKELGAGKSIIIFTTGTSMEPLLYDKKKRNATHVLVEPISRELSKGELPIVLLPDGRYMIHRIIRVLRDGDKVCYETRGDNCIGSEKVLKEAVLGVVTEIYRKKKTIKVTDKGYLLYVKFWMCSYPVRRILRQIHIGLSKIKRKMYGTRKES